MRIGFNCQAIRSQGGRADGGVLEKLSAKASLHFVRQNPKVLEPQFGSVPTQGIKAEGPAVFPCEPGFVLRDKFLVLW